MAGGDRSHGVPSRRLELLADDVERIRQLVEVVRRLRSPQGVHGREQTHASLRATMLEEAYEVLEAIDEQSMPKLARSWATSCCRS